VVSQSPFLINAQVPPDLPPGTYPIRVRSPYGSAEQMADVRATAPAIYVAPSDLASGIPNPSGVVANQDGTINAPLAPGKRGQVLTIFCTGLGAVSTEDAQFTAQEPVTVILNKVEIQPTFAGLSPPEVGLYKITVTIPMATPPGIDLPLLLRQAGGDSNTVFVAIQ